MKIGLVGGGFAAVRGALETAFAQEGLDAEIVDVPVDGTDAVDVLVPQGSRVDGALMDATGARLVQQFGVGLSSVDHDAAAARGIAVDNVSGAESGNATAVAEMAMLLLLALLRRLPGAQAAVGQRRVGEPSGATLAGRTVGVLGVGDIGTAVLRRLAAFDASGIGIGRRDLAEYPAAAALLDPGRYHRADDLPAALARCDDLVVAAPLTAATRGVVGTDALAALHPGGHVVNVARGGVVDYDALLGALRSGHLAGAGLDVTWTEPIDPADALLGQNVIVTPHVGGVTAESYAGMATGFAVKVRKAFGTG